MRRAKIGLAPTVDRIEPRVLPSTAAPLLSHHALSGVARDVRSIMTTLAKTQNAAAASDQLAGLSARIPAGSTGLAPSWQSDLALYRPHSAKSVIVAERQMLGDLYRYVEGGGTSPAGSGTVNAPASGQSATGTSNPGAGMSGTAGGGQSQGNSGTSAPAPAASLDSVTILNSTGLALTVTVHLEVPQLQKPWITETIPAQGSTTVLFNFGTDTNASMTMDVSLANGGQSPPPFTGVSLSQPLAGYDGTLYSISLLGPYFNVSVP